MTKVTLSAARVARDAVCDMYNLHDAESGAAHQEWCPKLYTGSHEELSDDAWIISWEEGVEREFVYDEELRQYIELRLRLHVERQQLKVQHRLEPVNHWCLAIFAEPLR